MIKFGDIEVGIPNENGDIKITINKYSTFLSSKIAASLAVLLFFLSTGEYMRENN